MRTLLYILDYLLQEVNLFFCRGPAGDEAADGVVMVRLAEVGELHLTAQTLHLFVVDDHELLIGGGVDKELVTLLLEDVLHPHGHLDGMFGEAVIENLSRPPQRGGE